MGIKIFNDKTNNWDKAASTVASSISVFDVKNNFESGNVEGCLEEISDDITKIEKDIKYIYENGTIGGGGGGGSTNPTVTIDGLTEIVVKSDEIIDIYYFFKSPNPGNGKATLSNGSDVKIVEIPQRRNKWTVGPFKKGRYVLTITVEDKQGFWSSPVSVTVVSGSLEISSDFNDKRDFTTTDDIKIPYNIDTLISEDVFVELTFNGETKTVPGNIGANEWKIGNINYLGVNTASIKAKNSIYESNLLNYTIVIADSENLLLSSTFASDSIQINRRVMIDYRISMKGQYQFKTDLILDGNKIATVNSTPGVNFWDVGTDLPLGPHEFKIITRTLDGTKEAEITLNTNIVSSGFEPFRPVTVGLIAQFDANGKLNGADNRNVWEDTSGNNVSCNLHNFNYKTNGWLENSLKLSGKTYAEVDLRPFANGVVNGITFDILYKIKNVGDIDANILSCKNPITPFQGISIDTQKATFNTKNSEIVSSIFQEDIWTRQTFVVDRATKTMKLYVNAILSNIVYLNEQPEFADNYIDEFTYNGKLLLGAEYGEEGQIIHNGNGNLKVVRIYDRALSSDEVLQNHIADVKDEDDQMAIRELNFGEETIPTLKISGNLEDFNEDEERVVQIDYHDPRDASKRIVKDGCKVSWQGTSSKAYPVKNYTVKLMEGGKPLLTYAPKDDWRPEDRWTLKANYMDSSHANNLGTNKFVHDFFKPNPYPQQVKDPTTRSNVDGFPIKLMVNGENMGIYTWNVDRYAPNNYGFVTYDKDGIPTRHPNAVSYEIGVNSTTGAGAFWDTRWESIRAEFKHRYNFRGDTAQVTEEIGPNETVLATGQHNELVNLVTWVCNSTDAEFYGELKEHFSVTHLIDYYLIAYALGMVDNLGKNMVLTTFGRNEDGNTIWYPSFYDCDSILGLANNGKITFGPGLDMNNGDYNTSNSALWTKLSRMFQQEIRDRYRQLRMPRNIDGMQLPAYFSAENLMSYYAGDVTDTVGHNFYNYDAQKKYLIEESVQWIFMCTGNRKEYTSRWLNERFTYLDSVYEHESYTNSTAVIRSNITGPVTLRLKTYSPQHISISFSDSSIHKVKSFVDKDRWYEFTADIANGRDNNITIFGADNVMYIDGIKDLNASFINIGKARKLVELDCSNSDYIQQIALNNNEYLQTVKCPNCKNLGLSDGDKILNLENCVNLKYLDCSKTKIGSVKFNRVGGVLDYLNCSNTSITTFDLAGQEYLESIELANCPDLSEFSVSSCNGLKKINMPNTKLAMFSVIGCDKVTHIDISQTKYLERLDLKGCPNLTVLKLQGVSNPNISEIDLSTALNLEDLDISSTSFIKVIVFGRYTDENGVVQNYNKLKKFRCANSVIEAIKYGSSTPTPRYMDLAGLTLEYVDFESCTNIERIKNINMIATGSSSSFMHCRSLISIEGNVTLRDSISRAFFDCKNLVTLPNLDLTNVTSMSETFQGCVKLTMQQLKYILSRVSSKFTSQWRSFAWCTGISGQMPDDLFSHATELTTMSEMLRGTKISGDIPVNLLKPMTNLNSVYYAFENTDISGGDSGLNKDIFKYNVNLVTTEAAFANTKINRVPHQDIFKYNLKLNDCRSMFNSCSQMTGTIPEGIFRYSRELIDAGSFFYNCPNIIGDIPRNIFNCIPSDSNGNNKLRYVDHFFGRTGVTGDIPKYIDENNKGLFDSSPMLDDVQNCFYLTGITGNIPTDIFKKNNYISKASGLFDGCSNLTGVIPPDLFKGKSRLLLAERVFKNCSELTSEIPKGFLDDCEWITNIAEMFYGCIGLSGQIPKRISRFEDIIPDPSHPEVTETVEIVEEYGLLDKCRELVSAAGLFYGCEGLRSEIPETLFIAATKVTDLSRIFTNCFYLYGPVPAKLFENCAKLTSVESAFHNCVGIGEYIIDDENKFAIPETLFSNCFELVKTRSMFRMDGKVPYSSKLAGSIPENLFRMNRKLKDIHGMFCATKIAGDLLGNTFRYNTSLEIAGWLFNGCKLDTLGANLFSTCGKIKDLSYTFNGNSTLTDQAPSLWTSPALEYVKCFGGCTGLSNYAQIPETWK